MIFPKKYDVIIVGAGHAGSEAALAAARMGAKTLCLTINLDTIALMPCNPSIGGPAKGHLCREIDALGGEMAKLTDRTHMHIRMLNTGKGPAVQALRAQTDRKDYQFGMKWIMENQDNLDIKQELVTEILTEKGAVTGVRTMHGWEYLAGAVVITTGTFLMGMIYIGDTAYPAGRMGEFPSNELSGSLAKLGLRIGRLKTGTVPRVDRRTIDYSATTPQYPSDEPLTFSFESPKIVKPNQEPCFLTYTTKKTKDIIMSNLHRSPLYRDDAPIKGVGPRYCPSIETKLVRFADKDTHQVFLEPEGRNTLEIYVQGLSTSLPIDVQEAYIKSVTGLEKAEIMRPGYAIEYDYVPPTQLYPWLETRKVKNLFLAGQINGTSGYEEAAAQGMIAAVNAVLSISGKEPLILTRDQAYTGVLIDDLVTLGTEEPYRMLTSRCEYRLTLRQDNADERLTPLGYKLGMIGEARYQRFLNKMENINREIERLRNLRVKGHNAGEISERFGTKVSPGVSFFDLLKRPEVTYKEMIPFCPVEKPITIDESEAIAAKAKSGETDIEKISTSSEVQPLISEVQPPTSDFQLPSSDFQPPVEGSPILTSRLPLPTSIPMGEVSRPRFPSHAQPTASDFHAPIPGLQFEPVDKAGRDPSQAQDDNIQHSSSGQQESYPMLSSPASDLTLPASLTYDEIESVQTRIKYEGYITRQEEQIEKFRKLEQITIPLDIDYNKIAAMKNEAREKLNQLRPVSIGQASRISGVTPSDVSMILIYLNKASVQI